MTIVSLNFNRGPERQRELRQELSWIYNANLPPRALIIIFSLRSYFPFWLHIFIHFVGFIILQSLDHANVRLFFPPLPRSLRM